MSAGFVKVVAYLPPWLAQHVKGWAFEEGGSLSDAIERALRQVYAPVNPIRRTVLEGPAGLVALALLCADGTYQEVARCPAAEADAVEAALRGTWIRAGILAMRVPQSQSQAA